MSTTSYGLGFEPFPLLLDYELGDHLMLRTDATENALFLGSHMNGNISEIEEALDERFTIDERFGDKQAEASKLEADMYADFISRLVRGGEGDTLSSLYYSMLNGYSTDEDTRAWLQGKGLSLPVVPFSDEPDSNADAVPDLDPKLSEDYLEQLDNLFQLLPGFTEDGKPAVWVHPGSWRMAKVVLMAESFSNPALLLMLAWDWDSEGFAEVFPEASAEARDNWIIDGYLDRREVIHSEGVYSRRRETEYSLPEETREKLERELRRSKVYGKSVKLERRVRVLDDITEYNGMVCKVGINIG